MLTLLRVLASTDKYHLTLIEVPTFIAAFVIAEVLYKFHSFALECAAFLITWYLLATILEILRRLFKLDWQKSGRMRSDTHM
jgi:hypothetical protein